MSDMVYTYPSFVRKVKSLELTRGIPRSRVKLELRFNRIGKRLVVILKNPSKADENISDHTINNVIMYVYRNLPYIGCICIYNVFVVYETNSSKLQFLNEQFGEDVLVGKEAFSLSRKDGHVSVDQILTQDLREASKVVLAWGQHPPYLSNIYRRGIKEISQLIAETKKDKSIYFVHSVGKGYPLHAQVWSLNYRMYGATIDGYRVRRA